MASKNVRGTYQDRVEIDACLARFRTVPVLRDQTEFRRLFREYTDGETPRLRERAEGLILSGNVRLILPVAREYLGRGVSGGDLFQAGMFGMRRALAKFTLDREAKFSTYACWWIRAEMLRTIDEESTLMPFRIPVGMLGKVRRLRRDMVRHFLDHLTWPTAEDMARLSLPGEFSPDEFAAQVATAQRLMEISTHQGVSIDAQSMEDERGEGFSLHSQLADPRPPSDELLTRLRASVKVRKLLQRFPERTRQILQLRFGLGGEDELTLEEIGDRYSLSRERIRQIESQALRELRFLFKTLGQDRSSFEL